MGLAISQVHFLTLTTRKADCEYGLSMDTMHKMSLTREMSQLTNEYNSRLQAKNVQYYANGEYKNIDYQYLMGGALTPLHDDNAVLKDDNNMILTDYKGRVVFNNFFFEAVKNVLGPGCVDAYGRGSTFSTDAIPQILANIVYTLGVSKDDVVAVLHNKELTYHENSYKSQNAITGEDTGNTKTLPENITAEIKEKIDFFYPILVAAANNGWTVEYNNPMCNKDHKDYNPNYVSDALISGSFQIMHADFYGNYDTDSSLTYFITADKAEQRSDSAKREEITAWYEAEKAVIAEKETMIDLHIDELSTELEAIKAQMDSIKSFIDDAVQSVFDWGSG